MPGAPENYCTYVTKVIAVCFVIIGIILSWIASKTCEFISIRDSDGDPPDYAEDPPFNRAMAAYVGIFRYQIIEGYNGAGVTDCVAYDDRWGKQQGYPSVATAQFCAVLAPCFAVMGAFAMMFDICVCNFPGSFMIAALFLLLGAGLQAGTFTIVADPVFCFEDSELSCSQERGVYLSIAATIFFFIASCLNCCAPQSDPFCFNFGQEHKPATRTVKEPKQTTVVLQPVIIQTDNNNNSNGNRKPNSKKKKGRPMSNKV